MGLPYLKIEPEDAIQVIDDCIVSGYHLKDKINQDYFADKTMVGQRISDWKKISQEWSRKVIEKLGNVFVSQKELYNFRDAPTSGMVRVGTNIEWNGIVNQIEARIGKLNEYDRYIREQFNIHIEVVGRDKITQIGNDAKTETLN